MPGTNKIRPYHAPARQAQAAATRQRVLDAAHHLFATRGLTTTIRQVADRAGVSRATVELTFGTKAALLGAVVDLALAGDDEPVAILDREWVAELAARPVADFLQLAGEAFAAGAARVAPVLGVIDDGARRDPSLAQLAARLLRQRRVMATWVVDVVERRDALAVDLTLDDAIETVLVVLDPAVHRQFLIDRHWTADQLGGWLGRSLRRLLLD